MTDLARLPNKRQQRQDSSMIDMMHQVGLTLCQRRAIGLQIVLLKKIEKMTPRKEIAGEGRTVKGR
jgi:hypothetical protein